MQITKFMLIHCSIHNPTGKLNLRFISTKGSEKQLKLQRFQATTNQEVASISMIHSYSQHTTKRSYAKAQTFIYFHEAFQQPNKTT